TRRSQGARERITGDQHTVLPGWLDQLPILDSLLLGSGNGAAGQGSIGHLELHRRGDYFHWGPDARSEQALPAFGTEEKVALPRTQAEGTHGRIDGRSILLHQKLHGCHRQDGASFFRSQKIV